MQPKEEQASLFVKNSIEIIRDLKIGRNDIIAGFHFKALYQNIPIDDDLD